MLRRNRLAKKYNIERNNILEFPGIFTITGQFWYFNTNQHSIYIYLYEYIIVYEYILYVYIYIYIYIYNWFWTHTHDCHTGFTFTQSFPAGFTSRNGLPNCEPKASRKSFLFFMVKFWQVSNIALTSSYRRCSIKKTVLKHLAILIGKHLCWVSF